MAIQRERRAKSKTSYRMVHVTEDAMKFANNHPAFRPRIEALVEGYFALIDEMAAELERRRMAN